MKTILALHFIGKSLAALLLALAIVQPASATAPRFSAAKLAAEAKPHLVAYEYPPLVTGNESEAGAAIEMVRQAFEAMGKPISIEVLPSRSFALHLLTDDEKVLGMLGEARLLTLAERKALAEEKCLRLTGKFYYYRPAHGEDLAGVRDLKALKGYVYGAVAGESTDAYAKAGIKVTDGEPKLLLRKLQNREIDFTSAFEPMGEWIITRLFPAEKDQFTTLPMPAWETTYSLWFNPAHAYAKEWRQVFVDGMKKLKRSGAYLEILRKYKLDDWALKP
ncbi:MAG: hypothetical protein PHE55_21905 [Methylococcaceae bacterium]|nr:hypothetical protein [Methylococcaceae bacterium]